MDVHVASAREIVYMGLFAKGRKEISVNVRSCLYIRSINPFSQVYRDDTFLCSSITESMIHISHKTDLPYIHSCSVTFILIAHYIYHLSGAHSCPFYAVPSLLVSLMPWINIPPTSSSTPPSTFRSPTPPPPSPYRPTADSPAPPYYAFPPLSSHPP